jgi:hypothetical protein
MLGGDEQSVSLENVSVKSGVKLGFGMGIGQILLAIVISLIVVVLSLLLGVLVGIIYRPSIEGPQGNVKAQVPLLSKLKSKSGMACSCPCDPAGSRFQPDWWRWSVMQNRP